MDACFHQILASIRTDCADLSVSLLARLVCLAEVEVQLVSTLLAQVLHDVEGAFAQRLAHGVEEHKDKVGLLAYGETKDGVEAAWD